MFRLRLYRFRIKALVLLLVGLALELALNSRVPSTGWAFVSDMFFNQAAVCFVYGLCHLLGNMHMFTSFTWGMKTFAKLFKGQQERAQELKDGYIAYRESRPVHHDVDLCFLLCAVLVALSLGAASLVPQP